jgi:bla regulator protein BlaR1
MTTYIIKIILCAAVFFLTYKLFLEREKMHLFNRFYLLLSLLLSFAIPAITFNAATPMLPIYESENLNTNILQDSGIIQILSPKQSTNYIFSILLSIYITITTLLLFRFISNLNKILSKACKHQNITYKNSKIVLINEDLTPHSFLNYLFINTKDYKNGNIENEILIHEYAHIQQKHSYDILFIEILQIVFWVNPLVFFYRKAILLNHEFLADEAVINTFQNIPSYQYLLIDKANKNKTYNLTSQFNYSITKKRLIMMTKQKSLRNALCRQIAIVPVLALSIFIFSTKSFAQDTSTVQTIKQNITPSTQEGVTKELLNEYEQIVNNSKNEKGFPIFSKFSDADKSRLETIYLLMSKNQQAKQMVIFMPATPPLPKVVPTVAQIESWKNSKIYGLWIDNKRVNNSELKKYKNTDFAQAFVSKLYGAAKKNVTYNFQVNLMTTKEYESYYRKTIETKNKYHMGFIRIGNK